MEVNVQIVNDKGEAVYTGIATVDEGATIVVRQSIGNHVDVLTGKAVEIKKSAPKPVAFPKTGTPADNGYKRVL